MHGKHGEQIAGLLDINIDGVTYSSPADGKRFEIAAYAITLGGPVGYTDEAEDVETLRYHETIHENPLASILVSIPEEHLRDARRFDDEWKEVWIFVDGAGMPGIDEPALHELRQVTPEWIHPWLPTLIEQAVAAQHASLAVAA